MKKFKFTISGNMYSVYIKEIENNIARMEVNGTPYNVEIHREVQPTKTPTLVRKKVVNRQAENGAGKSSLSTIQAPLPGTILQIKVAVGAEVSKGDNLLIMEAMKMENNVLAEKAGKIKKIAVAEGDTVLQGDLLFEIE